MTERLRRVLLFLAGTVNGYGLAQHWGPWMVLLGAGLYLAGTALLHWTRRPV